MDKESLTALTDEDVFNKYVSALIKFGGQIGAGKDIGEYTRNTLALLGTEVFERLTTASAEKAEAVARALFNLAEEENRAFLAFHPVTVFPEYKFEGLLKERFIRQATAAITAMGKRVKAGA